MTVSTIKAAIALMHDPEIDSVWEYEGPSGQTLWACYIEGQYLDIYGSCTAIKHDGEINEMGKDFLEMHTGKNKVDEIDYPISPETKKWWEERARENKINK